jgi:hypothetical protein
MEAGLNAKPGGFPRPPASQSAHSRVYSAAAWLLTIGLAGWGAAELLVVDLVSFAVLAGAAAAVAIFMLATNLPSVFGLIAAVTAFVNAGAYAAGYWGLPLYDEAVHTYTGFAVSSVFGYVLAHRRDWHPNAHAWAFGVAVVTFGLGAGILWEMLEMLVLDLRWWDTATDLIADTVGAFIAALFVAWKLNVESDARADRA